MECINHMPISIFYKLNKNVHTYKKYEIKYIDMSSKSCFNIPLQLMRSIMQPTCYCLLTKRIRTFFSLVNSRTAREYYLCLLTNDVAYILHFFPIIMTKVEASTKNVKEKEKQYSYIVVVFPAPL